VTGLRAKILVVLMLTGGLTGCTQVLDQLQPKQQVGPGSAYEDYLTGDRKLVVELDHAPGAKWDTSESAPADFERQLERITAKEVEVRTSADLPGNGKDYSYSTSELRDLHEQHRDLTSDSSKVVLHALFVDGKYQNENTVGVAFATHAFAMFMGTIEDKTCSNGSGITCPDRAERWEVVRAVSVHEAGHLFGLVNVPLEMQTPREDDDHPGHSNNQGSVMFWKVESSKALSDLFSRDTIPYQFDQYDMQDAQALRGG
jgi:hypothetical protein